jgi:hypothetical protein|tara:strand:+ start:162 stop:449 length:288 start_codon:yes stop_codon:yes gene_type:complete
MITTRVLDATLPHFLALPAPNWPHNFNFITFIENNLGETFPIHYLTVVSHSNELKVYPTGLKENYETSGSFKLSVTAIYGQRNHEFSQTPIRLSD